MVYPMLTGGIFSQSGLHVKEILLKQKARIEAIVVIKSVLHQPGKSKYYCGGVSDSQAVRVKESSDFNKFALPMWVPL